MAGREALVEARPGVPEQARRRILDLIALGGIAVGVAFVGAIATALVISWTVTNVIDRL